MARRAKRFPWFILAIFVPFVLAGGGIYFWLSAHSEPFRTVPVLPVADYTANATTLAGNKYRLTAEIDDQVLWEKEKGRIMSLKSSEGPVSVIFPASLHADNLARGQRIIALLEVGDHGLLTILAFQKQ